MTSGTTNRLTAVWGSSATDVFAVGWGGTILHYDGTSWQLMTSGTGNNFNAVWGSSATDVFAVGEYGTILHYGESHPPAESPTVSRIETSLNAPPPLGSIITLTFTPASTTASVLYRYWVASGYQTPSYGNWQMLKDWSTDTTLTWTPPSDDNYVVVVHVAQSWNRENFQQAGLTIETRGNSANPIQITGLTTDLHYPQPVNSPIHLDVFTEGRNALSRASQLYYKYLYCKGIGGTWNVIQDYSTSSTCTWTPTETGPYTLVVWVTDDPSGEKYALAGMTCTIGE